MFHDIAIYGKWMTWAICLVALIWQMGFNLNPKYHTSFQGLLSLMIFTQNLNLMKIILLLSISWPSDCNRILHMSQQLCCCDMCKILLQLIYCKLDERKVTFPLNLDDCWGCCLGGSKQLPLVVCTWYNIYMNFVIVALDVLLAPIHYVVLLHSWCMN